ncbi:type VII toxin-antitoxin system MntA family adenylyltransferase antitoxin [Phosphitispora fastidiosa]|uniref:type VII toxin-antitoxin system MntA family adenylyltransferase antitoxin n=1 Tax=Phosphitispora fastidiosa TaxID=2837202 RepID=UPI001E4310B6|nr:nucleotidyltransferase domain-containing protein [Phosphitispora fastidiosa]MBU7005985.1 putative nucleotidyltransferase [Phosphitispora fastidiosa]
MQDKVQEKTQEKMQELAQRFQLNLLVLLGSYAAGDFRQGESDIDLAYLGDEIKGIERHLELINELSRIFEYSKIDLIDLQKASGLLKYEIAVKGRVLFERSEGLFERYKLYCYRYYYDTDKFRQGKKEFFREQLEGLLNGKNRA